MKAAETAKASLQKANVSKEEKIDSLVKSKEEIKVSYFHHTNIFNAFLEKPRKCSRVWYRTAVP